MKRIIAAILAALTLFSICSCSRIAPSDIDTAETFETKETSDKHNTDGVFSVGFGRANITYGIGLPLAGFYSSQFRVSNRILDNLYMDFVVFQDESGNRALLVSADNLGFDTDTASGLIKVFAKAAGAPTENVIITCTHTHSAPDTAATDAESMQYIKALVQNGQKACEKAVADLDKAEIFIGSKEVEGLTFVRRYILEDGTFTGPNSGNTSTAPIASHEAEADKTLQAVRFKRENQKDIILANWQAHATLTSGVDKLDVSSDYVASFRSQAEKQLDAHVLFCEGAAGNQNPSSLIKEEKYISDHHAYGKKLADELNTIISGEMTKIDCGKIGGNTKTVAAVVRHDPYSMVIHANEVASALYANNRKAADELAHKYGFSSAYAASAAYTRQSLGETVDIDITTFSIGNIAFVGAPYEMFGTSGMQIKNASPFNMTFICYQANGKNGYFPTEDVFSHGSYEVDTSKFVQGTAEQFVGEFINQLNELHK